MNLDHVQSKEEVLAKRSGANGACEIDIRRAEYAHVDAPRFAAAESLEQCGRRRLSGCELRPELIVTFVGVDECMFLLTELRLKVR